MTFSPSRRGWLICLALVVCIGAVATYFWAKYSRVQKLAADVRAANGSIEITYDGPAWLMDWARRTGHESWLRWLETKVTKLSLSHILHEKSEADDALLSRALPYLDTEHLNLVRTQVQGTGLTGLERMANVKEFSAWDSPFGDAGMQQVAKLPALEKLSISDTNVTDVGLECLADSRTLSSVSLGGKAATDKGLMILNRIPSLKFISFDGAKLITPNGLDSEADPQLTNNGFRHLRDNPHLISVSVNGCKAVDDTAAEHLGTVPGLKYLFAHSTNISSEGLQRLRSCAALQTLYLHWTKVDDRGLEGLPGRHPQLQLLWLPQKGFTDQGLESLQTAKSLRTLRLGGVGITDRGMSAISKLVNLENLTLSDTSVGNAGLKTLQTLPNLKILDLSGSSITDAGLPDLKTFPALRVIWLNRTKVTAAGVAKLRSPHPQVEIDGL